MSNSRQTEKGLVFSVNGDKTSMLVRFDEQKQAGPSMELTRESDGAVLICDASAVRLGIKKTKKGLTFFSQNGIN
jgi:hypothetical protein